MNFWQTLLHAGGMSYRLANNTRRGIGLVPVAGAIHFLVLIAVHIGLQMVWPGQYSPFNSVWGTAWVLILMLGVFIFGGWPLHVVVGTALAGNHPMRLLLRGFFVFLAVETLANVVFMVVPFHVAWPLCFAAMSPVLGYFMFRLLDGKPINWGEWMKIPLTNIVIISSSIFFIHYTGRRPEPSDPMVWYFGALIVLLMSSTFSSAWTSFGISLVMVAIGVTLQFGLFDLGRNQVRSYWPAEQQGRQSLVSTVTKSCESRYDAINAQLKGGTVTAATAGQLFAQAEADCSGNKLAVTGETPTCSSMGTGSDKEWIWDVSAACDSAHKVEINVARKKTFLVERVTPDSNWEVLPGRPDIQPADPLQSEIQWTGPNTVTIVGPIFWVKAKAGPQRIRLTVQ